MELVQAIHKVVLNFPCTILGTVSILISLVLELVFELVTLIEQLVSFPSELIHSLITLKIDGVCGVSGLKLVQ